MDRASLPRHEDGTHRLLLLVLCLSAGWVVWRPPPDAALHSMEGAPDSGAREAGRSEIQSAIAALELWLTRAYEHAETPLECTLALYGLGRDKATAAGSPGACLNAWSPRGAADVQEGAAELAPTVAASVLLDVGIPRAERLRTADGEIALEDLVGNVLGPAREARVPETADSAWQLQLLALASASGIEGHRDELARRTESALTKLEHAYRALELGAPSAEPARVTEFAAATAPSDTLTPRALELQLSAAVFFANAVNPHPTLEGRVRRHLQSLLARYENDRANVRQALAEAARDPHALHARRLAALELYGRLGQALFMAHLNARSSTESVPPATAKIMRQAAGEAALLIEQLTSAGAFAEGRRTSTRERLAQFSSVVQALRGLRTARAALSS